ncbi:MAG: hypothetical protein M0R77_00695 [Gammaproteobacteria bacterium]|nr:hypothetical protein [Acholeplasmataceae bacterium]MCK9529072.1 hypothetical protein [Gammaproteobacteria bacterium]
MGISDIFLNDELCFKDNEDMENPSNTEVRAELLNDSMMKRRLFQLGFGLKHRILVEEHHFLFQTEFMIIPSHAGESILGKSHLIRTETVAAKHLLLNDGCEVGGNFR